jgi:hypothetical protein
VGVSDLTGSGKLSRSTGKGETTMFQIAKVKKDAATVSQPQHEARVLCLRIEQLEARISPRCIVIYKDQMTPK